MPEPGCVDGRKKDSKSRRGLGAGAATPFSHAPFGRLVYHRLARQLASPPALATFSAATQEAHDAASVRHIPGAPRSGFCTSACSGSGLRGGRRPPTPRRPVRLLVPFPRGALSTCSRARCLRRWRLRLGQPVSGEPRRGGNVAAEALAAAHPMGTLLVATIGVMAVNRHIYPRLPLTPTKISSPLRTSGTRHSCW